MKFVQGKRQKNWNRNKRYVMVFWKSTNVWYGSKIHFSAWI